MEDWHTQEDMETSVEWRIWIVSCHVHNNKLHKLLLHNILVLYTYNNFWSNNSYLNPPDNVIWCISYNNSYVSLYIIYSQVMFKYYHEFVILSTMIIKENFLYHNIGSIILLGSTAQNIQILQYCYHQFKWFLIILSW